MLRNSKTAKDIDTQEGGVGRASILRGFQTVFLRFPGVPEQCPVGWWVFLLGCLSNPTVLSYDGITCT